MDNSKQYTTVQQQIECKMTSTLRNISPRPFLLYKIPHGADRERIEQLTINPCQSIEDNVYTDLSFGSTETTETRERKIPSLGIYPDGKGNIGNTQTETEFNYRVDLLRSNSISYNVIPSLNTTFNTDTQRTLQLPLQSSSPLSPLPLLSPLSSTSSSPVSERSSSTSSEDETVFTGNSDVAERTEELIDQDHDQHSKYQCDYPGCKYAGFFLSKDYLRRHVREQHKKTRRHICYGVNPDGTTWGCNKRFNRPYQLVNHWKGQRSLKRCGVVKSELVKAGIVQL
ncbi:hypothetical protein DAMA08_000960 [Martiniozyma asiatica (nom. inval.)]|nr:hypothetical protein DAMA08_000960 [Martiniozyma asiatica]